MELFLQTSSSVLPEFHARSSFRLTSPQEKSRGQGSHIFSDFFFFANKCILTGLALNTKKKKEYDLLALLLLGLLSVARG